MRFVVDCSALLALVFDEPEREDFHVLLLANEPVMSIVSLSETYSVTRSPMVRPPCRRSICTSRPATSRALPVSEDDLAALRKGLLDFGKGRGEDPAVLNFGDLFGYALARRLDLPLLFKGDDFARTDVRPALP